jgi:hypothetical protein
MQSRPLALDSPIARDTGPYFAGERVDEVRRLPIPFHPITYVNQEVEASQRERMAHDPRGFSDPRTVSLDGSVLSSQTPELGFDPQVFVTRAVQASQREASFVDAVVAYRYTRTDLSSDGFLPRIGLFREPLLERPALFQSADKPPQPSVAPPPRSAAGREGVDADESNGRLAADAMETLDTGDAAALAGNTPVKTGLSNARGGAPSFSEQLRAGATSLPMAPRKS